PSSGRKKRKRNSQQTD
ncbi:hypothetical protein AB1N83_013148, partial [Pleurotus pulmonarius]